MTELRVTFPPVYAAVTGTIAGIVNDQSSYVIAGAAVTLTNTAQGFKNLTTTNSKGDYVFPSLPVDRYYLLVAARGFKRQTRSGLIVDLDPSLKIDLTVEVARDSLKLGDHVVVTGNLGRNPDDYCLRMQSIRRPSDAWKWSG